MKASQWKVTSGKRRNVGKPTKLNEVHVKRKKRQKNYQIHMYMDLAECNLLKTPKFG